MDRKPWVLHPLLFGVYPIVFLFAHNVDSLRVSSTLRALALTLVGVVTVLLLGRVFLRDLHKSRDHVLHARPGLLLLSVSV